MVTNSMDVVGYLLRVMMDFIPGFGLFLISCALA